MSRQTCSTIRLAIVVALLGVALVGPASVLAEPSPDEKDPEKITVVVSNADGRLQIEAPRFKVVYDRIFPVNMVRQQIEIPVSGKDKSHLALEPIRVLRYPRYGTEYFA